MTLLSVPIIDLAPYFSGTAEGKAEVAKKVDEACRSIGFLVITNHGISPELISRVSSLSRRFFDMPLARSARSIVRARTRCAATARWARKASPTASRKRRLAT